MTDDGQQLAGDSGLEATSAEHLARLVEKLPVPVCIFDARFTIAYANDEARRLDPAYQTGAVLGDLAPQVREQLEPLLSRGLSTGQVQASEGWLSLRLRGNSYLQFISVPLAAGLVAWVVIDQTAYKSAELAVMKSEERYRELVDSLAEGISVIDPFGTFEFANPALEKMLGVGSGELVGRKVVEFLELTDLEASARQREVARRGEPLIHELSFTRPDGEERELFISVVPRYDNRGQSLGSLALIQDITLLKRAEAALRAERNFTAAVIDTASALIVVLDRNGRILRFNRGCERLTGYAAAEVIGQAVWDMLLAPEDIEPVKGVFSELRAGINSNVYENYWLNRDGERRMISWSNAPIFDAAGQVEYVVGVGVDISDRVAAEEQVAQSERTARALLDASSDAAMLHSPEFEIIALNDAAAQVLGRPRDELIGQRLDQLVPAEVAARRKAQSRQALESGRPLNVQDEEHGRLLDVILRPVLDARGRSVMLAVFVRDITEQKQAENQLRASESRFRSLVETMRAGVVIRDREFNITYANQAICDLLGRSRDDLIGLNLADLLEPGEFQKVLKSVEQQSASGALESYVLSFIGAGGRRLKAEVTPQPELTAEGLPDAKFAIIRELRD